MGKPGRKPLLTLENLENGGKIKLSVKQAAFGYQYAYSLRVRYPGRSFKYNRATRELSEETDQTTIEQ